MSSLYTRELSLLWLVIFISALINGINFDHTVLSFIFLLSAAIFQTTLLILPVYIFTLFVKQKKRINTAITHILILSLIILTYSNYKVFELYGFYINGFIINLVTTKGGVEALGLTSSFYVSATLLIAAIIISYFIFIRYLPIEKLTHRILKKRKLAIALIVFIGLFQWIIYAVADYRADIKILQSSNSIAWYIPITAKTSLQKLGLKGRPYYTFKYPKFAKNKINYPLSSNLKISKPYNIVWLTVESWRADMVNKDVMPKTFQFAQENNWFKNHYSGGNGTRMGVFTQFYGMYGSFWFDFLNAKREPFLFDVLINANYKKQAYTSAAFTYPEFDKTVFSGFDPSTLQEGMLKTGWENDRYNVDGLIGFIDKQKSPFFSFMFFESPHANYYFPDENIIEPEFTKDFDYLATDIKADIKLIKNRYINACNHLDSQLSKIFIALKEKDLLDNTIVIVTGDHGEEFMEKGQWGHNSTFSQEQIRVPLIIHMPDMKQSSSEAMTSHLDLPATVLAALSNKEDSKNYSYGADLFSKNYSRNFAIVSDWHGDALVTEHIKYVLSNHGARAGGSRLSSIDDAELPTQEISKSDAELINQLFSDLKRFF